MRNLLFVQPVLAKTPDPGPGTPCPAPENQGPLPAPSDAPDGTPLGKVQDALGRIEQLRAEGAIDTTDYGAVADLVHSLGYAFVPALASDRDQLADELVKLGDYLTQADFVRPDSGSPLSDVDVAIHHLGLAVGYKVSVERAAGIIDGLNDQVADLTNGHERAQTQIADLTEKLRIAQNGGHRRNVLRTYGDG